MLENDGGGVIVGWGKHCIAVDLYISEPLVVWWPPLPPVSVTTGNRWAVDECRSTLLLTFYTQLWGKPKECVSGNINATAANQNELKRQYFLLFAEFSFPASEILSARDFYIPKRFLSCGVFAFCIF